MNNESPCTVRTRIDDALTWMARELSLSDPDSFRRHHQPGGDMLLQACLSQGYLRMRGRELVLTPMGHRRQRATATEDPSA